MPELPDVALYCEALAARIAGRELRRVRLGNPFLLRTAVPPVVEVEGKVVRSVRRLGKRIVLELDDDLYIVLHLMIAGRLRWLEPGAKSPARITLALLEFPNGTLAITEAGTKRRAAMHVVRGEASLQAMDAGGLEVLACDRNSFAARLTAENHTLKRALTDPHLFSGIGNAYSDEILHRAKLSPFKLTRQLTSAEITVLHDATVATLAEWTARLQDEAGEHFPEKVTAFRDGMAVHGRFGQPCPRCGTPVQRIVHGEHEVNYCPACQTEGRLLADRALSKLLKDDWPKTLDELERRKRA